MKNWLKKVLTIGEQVAVATVPGAQAIDAAVRVIATKGSIADAGPEFFEGVVRVIKNVKKEQIADEAQFKQGLTLARSGLEIIKHSLKKVG